MSFDKSRPIAFDGFDPFGRKFVPLVASDSTEDQTLEWIQRCMDMRPVSDTPETKPWHAND